MRRSLALMLTIVLALSVSTGCAAPPSQTSTPASTTKQPASQQPATDDAMGGEQQAATENSGTNESESPEKTPDPVIVKYEELLSSLSELIEEGKAFDIKDYTKGEIPVGEYAYIMRGSTGYYSEEDADGNIIDEKSFDSFGYVYVNGLGNIKTKGMLVSVEAFEVLGVSGAREMYEVINDIFRYRQSGMYKVGFDLPAGDYSLESLFDRDAYYGILSAPVGSIGTRIMEDDSFRGSKTISVSDGQYLTLDSAMIN